MNTLFQQCARLALLWAYPLIFTCSGATSTKPNIVLLYIDDWAWNGTPVRMHEEIPNSRMPVLEMPHVERLAREGMKFQNAYGSPQCSPARACILTGQAAPRHGFTVFMNDKGQEYYDAKSYKGFPVVPCVANMEVSREAPTIPKVLAPLGYATAHIGKWHLRANPGDYGYQVHDGPTSNNEGNTLRANLKEGEAKPKRIPDNMTDPKLMFSNTEKAIGFMRNQAMAQNPFYLQVSHYAMHAGSECLPATREKYARHPWVQAYYKEHNKTAATVNLGDDPAVWLGMGEDLDRCIGMILEELHNLGIEDNTYVVLAADNGYRHHFLPGLTQPLHSHKWWVWEGGIRVPMIVRGPGVQAGSTFTPNVANYDFLPTFLEWAGGDPGSVKNLDGISLAPYLAGRKPGRDFLQRGLYFHYPHYRSSMPHSAMVSGEWKVMHFYERPDIPMLFQLSRDIGEVHNIAPDYPSTHQDGLTRMMDYFMSVGARMPKPNPESNPEVYRSQKEYSERVQWGPFEGSRPLEQDEVP